MNSNQKKARRSAGPMWFFAVTALPLVTAYWKIYLTTEEVLIVKSS
jgi:hypothetical protein